MEKKGFSNSKYALITTLALITGLMLLSYSGNPYSLAGQSSVNEIENAVDAQDIEAELPEDTPLEAGDYLNTGQKEALNTPDTRNLVSAAAKKIFQTVSGKNPGSPPQKPPNGNNSRTAENSTGSQSENNTVQDDPSQDQDEGDEGRSGNNSSSPQNDTGSQTGQQDNSSQPFNQTGNSSGTGLNRSGEQMSEKGNSTGTVNSLIKTFSDIFQSNSSESSRDRTEQNSESQQEQSEESQQEPNSGTEDRITGIADSMNFKIILGLLAVALAAFAVYRSDKSWKELLLMVKERLKQFVNDLPDLFKRSLVKAVSFIGSKLKAVLELVENLLKSPADSSKGLILSIRQWVRERFLSIKELKETGLRQVFKERFSPENKLYTGLDKVWHQLKRRIGLENESSLTPAEVRREALRHGVPEKTVEEVVEAFRREKYTSREQDSELDIDKLLEELEADEDE